MGTLISIHGGLTAQERATEAKLLAELAAKCDELRPQLPKDSKWVWALATIAREARKGK